MGKFTAYNIVLKDLSSSASVIEYKLDNNFFEKIDDPDIRRGKVNAIVNIKKTGSAFELDFELEGNVQIACNRCLDDMEQAVWHKSKLTVKFGKGFSEEKNNVVIVPEAEGEINIAWFLFEFIALSIPIKHVHAPGKCNKTMMSKLSKHSVKNEENESEYEAEENNSDENTDPRWDALRDIKIDND